MNIPLNYRIWKYKLEITGLQKIEMPKGSEVLSVDNQNGRLCLWAKGDINKPKEVRHFEIFGTGDLMPSLINLKHTFIGTVQIPPFVWHVFEIQRDTNDSNN